MTAETEDHARSFQIARRALELMETYGSSANPRSYEVWYTYVTGEKPAVNAAIKRLASQGVKVREADIDALYNEHLAPRRFVDEAEKAGATVIEEMNSVMEMLETALGSTARYGQSLEAFSNDIAVTIDKRRLREITTSLATATKEAASTNKTLETRLRETCSEIEVLHETLEAMRLETLTDSLTGIANRKHFDEMLTKSIDEAVLARSPLALIVMDIDHFKRFNDTFGHLTGDQVLRLVGSTMREQVKSRATLARFGGEEFAIILPATTRETALASAERVRMSVMSRDLVKRSTGQSLGKVTISAGVATLRKGDTAATLLERADQCMFSAKRNGRNRTVTEADMDEEACCDSGTSNVA